MKTDNVIELLRGIGPCLSGRLAQAIQESTGVSAVAARKQIERARESLAISSFGDFQLKHGEQFLYLKDHSGSPSFRQALLTALQESKSAYGRVLFGVMARGGIVPESMFATVSGLPVQVKQDSHYLTADEALRTLDICGLLWTTETKAGRCIMLSEDISEKRVSDRRLIARLRTEGLVLAALRDWFILQGLTSSVASSRDDREPPQFGYFQWDLVAPSYISALRTGSENSKLSPGFLVADVILGRILSVNDVKYFVEKSNAIRKRFKNRPFIPFLVAEWFDKEALNLGRKQGFVFTTVKNLFGQPFYRALKSVGQLIEDKSSVDDKAKEFTELIYSISHMTSALEVAKETIFELIVGRLFTRNQYTFVEYNRVFNDFKANLSYEMDILVHSQTSIRVMQCKSGPASFESIRDWFMLAVPLVHSILLKQDANKHITGYEYVFCSATELPQESFDFVATLNQTNLAYRSRLLNAGTLRELVEDSPHLKHLYGLLSRQAFNEDMPDFLYENDD